MMLYSDLDSDGIKSLVHTIRKCSRIGDFLSLKDDKNTCVCAAAKTTPLTLLFTQNDLRNESKRIDESLLDIEIRTLDDKYDRRRSD